MTEEVAVLRLVHNVTAIVISRNEFFRKGVRHALRDTAYEVVADAPVARRVESSSSKAPVALLIWSPDTTDDLEAEIVQVRSHLEPGRHARLVVLMNTDDVSAVRRVAALGVDAIFSESVPSELLPRMLEIVMLGQQVFPAVIAQPVGELVPSSSAPHEPGFPAMSAVIPGIIVGETGLAASLTEREAQILRCLVNGASNKNIALQLRVTEPTVKAHVKGLLRKIGVSNRTQAAIWALNQARLPGPS